MDVQGILGIDSDVRNGFGGINVNYEIDADASREDIEGACCTVAETFRRLRHHHQSDRRLGQCKVA